MRQTPRTLMSATVVAARIASPPTLHATERLVTVTMALSFVNVLPAGFWVAKDRGLFRKYGIDLQIVTFSGTMPERLSALLSNAIQGTVIDRTETPPSALGGSELVMLADFSQLNIPWEHDIVMTTRRYLSANRAVVEGLLKGLVEGNAYILAPHDKRFVLRIIAGQLHLDSVQQAETLYQDAVAGFVVRKPYVNRKTLAATA